MYRDIPEPSILKLIETYQPNPPADTAYLFHWFMDLSAARTTTQFGLAALKWPEIESYFRCRGLNPNSYDIRAMQALDSVFLTVMGSEEKHVIGSEGFKNGDKTA